MSEHNGTEITVQPPLVERVLKRARNAVQTAPGGNFVLGQARAVENVLVQHLKSRLDNLNGHTFDMTSVEVIEHGGEATGHSAALSQQMAALSERSLDQTAQSAREALFGRMMQQLLPDEARILTAVSDGSSIAVSHLLAGSRLKSRALCVLGFQSRVGHECGVMLTDAVSHYLRHLFALGLLEAGAEDSEQRDKYESIENDAAVREAYERIRKDMKLKPCFVRETARLSALGREFWSACSG